MSKKSDAKKKSAEAYEMATTAAKAFMCRLTDLTDVEQAEALRLVNLMFLLIAKDAQWIEMAERRAVRFDILPAAAACLTAMLQEYVNAFNVGS